MDILDEKTAKKIGEVLAFTVVGLEILEKGRDSLLPILGKDMFESLNKNLTQQKSVIHSLIKDATKLDLVLTKSKKTGQKLHSMQDLYLQDQWDDPTEIMEWLGFFEGAAIVHCSLVEKRAGDLKLTKIIKFARQAKQLHQNFLQTITNLIS